MRNRNVVVAQSGGPSLVINCSLRGVIDVCRSMPDTFGTVYAGYHGIEGVLREELLDLSSQPDEEIALLSTTPAAGVIGTCRYKLRDDQSEDYERIIDVFRAHNVGYFLQWRQRLDGDGPQGGYAGGRGFDSWPSASPRPSITTWAIPRSSSLTTRGMAARRATGRSWCRVPTQENSA